MITSGPPVTEEQEQLARRAIDRQVADEKLTEDDAQVVREALAL